MKEIGEVIALCLKDFEKNKEQAVKRVRTLTDKYPLYE